MRNYKPIDASYDPLVFKMNPDAPATSPDRKAPHVSELYPDLEQYQRVSVERYHSREFMKLEWERMWTRVWTCAGRVSDLPDPGSYFTYDLGREPFIIVRNHDGEIRAFHNVCQHRGRLLVEKEFGTVAELVCPFHSWAFDLDGNCTRVTDEEVFGKNALCGDLSLKAVRCEVWGGFVFINMDPDAKPLIDFVRPIADLLETYSFEEMFVVKDSVLPIAANWKVGLDIFLEAYHLHSSHPQALAATEDYYMQTDIYENGHGRQVSPIGVPSVRLKDQETVNPLLKYLLADAGIDPDTYKGPATGVREALLKHKLNPDNAYGLDFSRFTPSQVTDDWNFFIFPNMTLNVHPEGVLVLRFLPHATDPEQFHYHAHIIMPKLKEGCTAPYYMGLEPDADISGNVRPARTYKTVQQPDMGEVLDQDIGNMEATQRGLHSVGFKGGMRFSSHEVRDQVMHAELDRYLRGEK